MTKKTRIYQANILAEQRYLSEKFINEDETNLPLTGKTKTSNLLTNPWQGSQFGTAKIGLQNQIPLTPSDKTKIQSILLNKINTSPELQTHLGLPSKSHYTEEDLKHSEHNLHVHGHGDGEHYTISLEGPEGITIGVVAGLGGHGGGDTHSADIGDTHGAVPTAEIPHEKLGVTAKIPFSVIFKGG